MKGLPLEKRFDIQEVACRWAVIQPSVAAFISLFVTNFHDGQDVLQEVAAAVISHDFETQGWPESFQAWVIGIARHKAMDFLRRKGGNRMVFDTEAVEQLVKAQEMLADHLLVHREALEHCLKKVQGHSLSLLELRYQADLKPQQIAQRVGMTVGSVKVMLHRARLSLRNCIERRVAAQGTWK